MATHSSARKREDTPQANSKQRTANSLDLADSKQRTASSGQRTAISNELRRRAQSVINDKSIDPKSRAVIRYALEINDPWLPELVRRADAGETIIYTVNSLKHPHPAKQIQVKQRLKH